MTEHAGALGPEAPREPSPVAIEAALEACPVLWDVFRANASEERETWIMLDGLLKVGVRLGALRAVRAEREQLQRLSGYAEAEVEALQAQVGALREALAPFIGNDFTQEHRYRAREVLEGLGASLPPEPGS